MQAARIRSFMAGLIAAALLLSLSASPAVWASAGTPEDAVSALVKPLSDPSAGGGSCDTVTGQVSGCPITPRLMDRLQHPIVNVETGNLVSRAQNPPQSVALKTIDNDGQVAHVVTVWSYGPGSYSITFVVTNQSGNWLVDDSYCTGNPETTIYTTPTGPCSLDVTTPPSGGIPGMPRTGEASDYAVSIIILLACVLAVVGLGLSFRGRNS